MEIPKALERILGRRPVLWVGAGVSRQADPPQPTLWELAERLKQKNDWDDAPAVDDAYRLFDLYLENRIGLIGDLEAFLAEQLRPDGRTPSPGALHRHLSMLAAADRFCAVLDTNYDLILRSAFDDTHVSYTPGVLDQNLNLPDTGLRYLSLHGSFDDWSRIVLTGESYGLYRVRYPYLQAQLDLLLLRHPALFLGTSLLDPRLLEWAARLRPEDRARLKLSVALVGPGEKATLARAEWNGQRVSGLLDFVEIIELPDFRTLPRWFETLAKAHVAPPVRKNLEVEIDAGASWKFTALGESVDREPVDLRDQIAALRVMAGDPLGTDPKGTILEQDRARFNSTEQLAAGVGDALFGLLPDAARGWLEQNASRSAAPVLRLRVRGSDSDALLLLPWETLRIAGDFPVQNGALHLLREVVTPGGTEIPEPAPPLSVVAHMAAPFGKGVVELNLESVAYGIARALDPLMDRVRVSDLGSLEDLGDAVGRVKPVLLHYSGHGQPGRLLFEDDWGAPAPVTIPELLDTCIARMNTVPLAVWLSCCHGADRGSGDQDAPNGPAAAETTSLLTELHRNGVAQVLGWFGTVADPVAVDVDRELFAALVDTGSTLDAVRRARLVTKQPFPTRDGLKVLPFFWMLLALYHRGPDRPLVKPATARAPDESRALIRDRIALEGVEVLEHGFVGRRRLLARLRKLHRDGRRVLGLYGLGGLGKTATMTRLASMLAGGGQDWQSRVLVIPAAEAPDPDTSNPDSAFTWLVQKVDHVVRSHGQLRSAWEANVSSADTAVNRSEALARLLLAVTGDMIVCIDNAERLQDLTAAERAPWRSDAVARFFATLFAEESHAATVLITTRYRPSGEGGWWEEIPPCSKDEIFRMTGWWPVLQRLPMALREELVEQRLTGHPRSVQFVNGLLAREELRRGFHVTPDHNPDLAREQLLAPALEGLPHRIEQDLALEMVIRRLEDEPRRLLAECTAINLPVPFALLDQLGQGRDVLRSLGLLTRVAAGEDGWFVHPFVTDTSYRLGLMPTRDGRSVLGHYWLDKGVGSGPAGLSEALRHLIAAQEWEDASHAMGSLSRGHRHSGLWQQRLAMLRVLEAVDWPPEQRDFWLFEIADALDDMGQYSEAERYVRESVMVSERIHGTRTHPSVATSLNGLANVLWRQDRYGEAEAMFREVIEIMEAVHGTRSLPEVAASLHGLGSVWVSQGKYAEAEAAYRESIGILETAHGSRVRADIAASLVGLANALSKLDAHGDAETTYRESIEILETIYGTRARAEVAAALHGLANVLVIQRRYVQAEAAYRESIEIEHVSYGTLDHPSFIPTFNALAGLLQRMGRLPEAIELARRALALATVHDQTGGTIAAAILLFTMLKQTGATEEVRQVTDRLRGMLIDLPDDHPARERIEAQLAEDL